MAEVDLIRVELEDLVFGEILLDVDGQEGLVHLAAEALFRRQEDLLGKLLGQRRGSLDLLPGNEVLETGTDDGLRIDAAVMVEVRILGGDDGVDQMRRDVALADHDPPLNRILREGNAATVV